MLPPSHPHWGRTTPPPSAFALPHRYTAASPPSVQPRPSTKRGGATNASDAASTTAAATYVADPLGTARPRHHHRHRRPCRRPTEPASRTVAPLCTPPTRPDVQNGRARDEWVDVEPVEFRSGRAGGSARRTPLEVTVVHPPGAARTGRGGREWGGRRPLSDESSSGCSEEPSRTQKPTL